MAPIVVRYPLDPTGVSPDNLVLGEEHTLSNRPIKAFATDYGGFYTESVVLREKATQRLLTKNVDYYCAELYEVPTAKFGKEVCSVVVITDDSVQPEVEFSYQAVGGAWSTSQQAIIQMVDALDLDDRPVTWGDIIGKPTEFNPAHHLHDSGDIFGMEYIVAALERIYQAILMGDTASHDEIYRYIDAALDGLDSGVEEVRQDLLDHIIDTANPHNTTPGGIGAYTKAEVDALLTTLGNNRVLKAGDTMTGVLTGATRNLAMVQSETANLGSMVFKSSGTGDGGLAGVTFWNDSYGIKMGVRHDGTFGIGGWSSVPWRWHNTPAGDTIQAGDCYIYSDPRLKENKTRLGNVLSKLNYVNGYAYTWKNMGPKLAQSGKLDFGLMADEVEAIFPELVQESIVIDGESYKTVAYTKFVPILLEAVKELSDEIQILREEIRSKQGE